MERKLLAATLIVAGLCAHTPAHAKKDYFAQLTPQQLFEQICSSCHNLELPKSQRLDRANWEWVVDDMIDYGLMGVPKEHLDRLIDYLAETYGPTSK